MFQKTPCFKRNIYETRIYCTKKPQSAVFGKNKKLRFLLAKMVFHKI